MWAGSQRERGGEPPPDTRSPEVSPVSTPMSTLGRCPRCETRIPESRLLIEYETAEGAATYAECPACRDVVHPA